MSEGSLDPTAERHPRSRRLVVVKIGSSSVTDKHGVDQVAIDKLCTEVAALMADGSEVVVVTSGAIATGLPAMGMAADGSQSAEVLRAASAVGQTSLMRAFESALAQQELLAGQVLLAPTDFMLRRRYLKSRGTIRALLDLGVVPVINENDAIADDEIRFGDNDRLAALVAHLVEADLLLLLTDTEGLFTADPRTDASASLIEEITEIDHRLEEVAGGARSAQSRGGMASKLAAAKIATWSGVETVIASATRVDVVRAAGRGDSGIGSRFVARDQRLGARKLWIAFALPASGTIEVDRGARRALEHNNRSLLPAGIVSVRGAFTRDDAVEIVDPDGVVFAKGQVRWSSGDLDAHAGRQTTELPVGLSDEVVHRDDLILLPT